MNICSSRFQFQNEKSVDKNVETIKEYLAWVCQTLNAVTDRIGLDCGFGVEDPDFIAKKVSDSDGGNLFLQGKGERLYEETCQTVLEVIKSIIQGNSVALIGAVQSGKSTVISACYDFLSPILYLTSKKTRRSFSMIWLPNNLGMEKQSQQKYKLFSELHRYITIGNGNGYIEVNQYMQESRREFNAAFQKIHQQDVGQLNTNVMVHTSPAMMLRRTHGQAMQNYVRAILTVCVRNGWSMPFFVDESHIAMKNGSSTDNLCSSPIMEDKEDKELSNMVNTVYDLVSSDDVKKQFPWIAVSATNYTFGKCSGFKQVYMKIGKNYGGNGFLRGRDIDPDAVKKGYITQPKVRSVSEIADMSGDASLMDIDRRSYNEVASWLSKINFEQLKSHIGRSAAIEIASKPTLIARRRLAKKYIGRRSVINAHKAYQEDMVKALARLIRWILITGRPQPENKGLILRWENNNEKMKFLVDNFLRPEFEGELDFIDYHGNIAQTPVALIGNRNRPYVVVVTGHGRYQESYPADCAYGIDFSPEVYRRSTFIQGIPGRISGYNKKPFLVVPDGVAEWYHTQFFPTKDDPSNTEADVNTITEKRRSCRPILELNCQDAKSIPLYREYHKNLEKYVNETWSQSKNTRICASSNIPVDLLKILPVDLWRMIEEEPFRFDSTFNPGTKVCLLLPGEEDSHLGRPYGTYRTNGYTKYALRRLTETSSDTANRTGTRKKEEYQVENGYQLHFHYKLVNGKISIECIIFRLTEMTEYDTPRVMTLKSGCVPDSFDQKMRRA
jgi:hypothetical protein